MTGHEIVGVVLIAASVLVWGMAFAAITYVVHCAKELLLNDQSKR